MLVEILVIIIIIKIIVSLTILKISCDKVKKYKNTIEDVNLTISGMNEGFRDKCCEVEDLKKEIKDIKEEMEVYIEQEKKTYEPKLDQLKKIRKILES